MEKYMKFTMFKKETTDKKYHENPYRTVNFKRDGSGNLICPNGRKFHLKAGRMYTRTNMEERKKSMNVNRVELTLISCGFNLYKYHNKKQRKGLAA